MKLYNERLDRLKNLVFASNNTACFIERERFLNTLDTNVYCETSPHYYAQVLAGLLEYVSVPISSDDVIVGRVVEGVTTEFEKIPCNILQSKGHMSFEYARMLKLGFRGILEEIKQNAQITY